MVNEAYPDSTKKIPKKKKVTYKEMLQNNTTVLCVLFQGGAGHNSQTTAIRS